MRWLWFAARACVREYSFGPLRAVIGFLRLPRLAMADKIIPRPLDFLIAYEEAAELAPSLPMWSPLKGQLNDVLRRYRAHAEEAAFATGLYGVISGAED